MLTQPSASARQGSQAGPDDLPLISGRMLIAALITWCLCGVLYLHLPPSPDQFNHAYLGWRLVEGDIPYRSPIDMNWPAVMGLHGLAVWLFGPQIWAWRALDIVLFAISALFLSDLVRRAAGTVGARVCLLAAPVFYVGAGHFMSGQHDMSAAQFLIVALWLHVRALAADRLGWYAAAGFLIGAAMLSKPTVGILLPLLTLHAWLHGTRFRRLIASLAVSSIGLVIALALAVLLVLQRGTTVAELIDATFTYNATAQYATELIARPRSPRDVVHIFLQTHYRRWADLTVGTIVFVLLLRQAQRRSTAATVMPVLWLAGVVSYFVQGRGFQYHLAPAFPALIGMTVMAAAWLCTNVSSAPRTIANRRLASAALAALLVATQAYKLLIHYQALPSAWLTGDYSDHLAGYPENDGLTVADAAAFAQRISAQDDRSECVLVAGQGSGINYLSQHPQPTRFYYIPVIIRAPQELELTRRWWALWKTDLEEADCRYALVATRVQAEWLPKETPPALALREFLRRYEQTGMVGGQDGLVVYERR